MEYCWIFVQIFDVLVVFRLMGFNGGCIIWCFGNLVQECETVAFKIFIIKLPVGSGTVSL